jgi:hypothetical protein
VECAPGAAVETWEVRDCDPVHCPVPHYHEVWFSRERGEEIEALFPGVYNKRRTADIEAPARREANSNFQPQTGVCPC